MAVWIRYMHYVLVGVALFIGVALGWLLGSKQDGMLFFLAIGYWAALLMVIARLDDEHRRGRWNRRRGGAAG